MNTKIQKVNLQELKQKVIDRFWKKVNISKGKDACWNWEAATDGTGRGTYGIGGSSIKAPRIALALSENLSYFPDSKFYCISICLNPLCCNPRHLCWGEKAELTDYLVREKIGNFGKNEAKILRPDGETEVVDNANKYARENDLDPNRVSQMISQRSINRDSCKYATRTKSVKCHRLAE